MMVVVLQQHDHMQHTAQSSIDYIMTKQYPDVSDDGQELYICKTCQTIIYSTLSLSLVSLVSSVYVCEILLH